MTTNATVEMLMVASELAERSSLEKFADPFDFQGPQGALAYIVGDLYIFYIIHTICHRYFAVAIEMVVELSGMNEDVAGATLMAIGTSTPELLAGLVGVFVPGAGDAGLATVVGSLVFNMLVINGMCIIAYPGASLKLRWESTVRDVLYQALVILVLVWAFHEHPAVITENTAWSYVGLYVVYILVCWKGKILCSSCPPSETEPRTSLTAAAAPDVLNMNGRSVEMGQREQVSVDSDRPRSSHGSEPGSFGINPRTSVDSTSSRHSGGTKITPILAPTGQTVRSFALEDTHVSSGLAVYVAADGGVGALTDAMDDHGNHNHEPFLIWPPPSQPTELLAWIVTLPLVPVKILLSVSIPDCTAPFWQANLAVGLTLCVLMSIIWIGLLVFFMTEWATKAGKLMGISDTAMGLTFLAIGTSLPDCLCSIIVAQKGFGEMAVSNVFGSNVFDILIALGVPWTLDLAVGGKIEIESDGFLYSAAILASILFVYTTLVVTFRCSLPTWSGQMLVGLYGVYVVYVFATM